MLRVPPVLGRILIAAILVIAAWRLAAFWSSQRALATHLDQGQAYAARALEPLGAVPDELRESSGVAVSRTQPGVLWSHNDSGDGPVLYAIDITGRLLAVVRVTEATARDWEDIAAGPCPLAGSSQQAVSPPDCLFLADIGNNNRTREELTVYVLPEPRRDAGGALPASAAARAFRFRYSDEPHDAEAIAVRPDGDITIVTKGRTGTIDFFGIPAGSVREALASGEAVTAEFRGRTGIEPDGRVGRLVTGAAVSPDGMTLAVRTYTEVFFFGLVNDGTGTIQWRDMGRPCFLGEAEPQGEAIDYLDAETLILTSERSRGRPGVIHRLRC